MSWVIVVWSMAASASLTLAGIHFLVWVKERTARADLVFSITAVATAGMAATEVWMMRAGTAEQFSTALRWAHVPIWIALVSLVLFARLYLRAGRAWLAWGAIAARTLSLIINFLVGPNINFRVIAGLRRAAFLGERVAVPIGVPNPWMLLAQLATLLLAVFVADAAATAWRRGDRRAALTVGGGVVLFVLAAFGSSFLTLWQVGSLPIMNSIFYMAVIAAMAAELTRDTIRAAQLADDLRESESRYRAIFEGALEGIFRTTSDGKALVINPTLAKMLGYESTGAALTALTEIDSQIWADERERAAYVRRLEERGSVQAYECRLRRKDGTVFPASVSARVIPGAKGQAAVYDGFIQDITERKKAEESLRRSQHLLAETEKIGRVGGWEFRIDTQELTWTPEVYAIHEVEPDVPISMERAMGFVTPDSRERILSLVGRAVQEGQPYDTELELVTAKGNPRTVHTVGRADPENRRVYGFFQDITEHKRAEEALGKSRSLLAEIERIGQVGGWEIDIRTMKQTWTPEIYNIHEVDPSFEPTVEKGIGFYTPDSRPVIARLVRRAIEFGEPFDTELDIVTAKGRKRNVHAMGRADLPNCRVYGFFQDITGRKQNELELAVLRAELTHLARVLTVDEISTSLAHEINQPLGAILNNAEAARALLAQPMDKPEPFVEIIDDIIVDAKRAGDVIRKVRGVLKKGEAKLERLPVNPLIGETLEIVRNNLALNGVAHRLELGTGLADVRGDRVRLQQVLMNLITNAMDAMKRSPSRVLTLRSAMDGPDMVTVSVGDSGPGVPRDRRTMIFEPFFSTKKGGLGLGLPISRSIIEEHGGRIWVDDGPGGGTVFSFSLKAWREAAD